MTISKLIENMTILSGQQFDTELIIGWVNEIEAQAIDQIINTAEGNNIEFIPYVEEQDMEKELLIPDQFRDVYMNYIRAKIDFMNQETERYNNDAAMFDAAWKEYASWHIRRHIPKPAPRFRHF